MQKLIQPAKYMSLVAVVSLLAASLATFCWGAFKTFNAIALMVTSQGQDQYITLYLIQLVDVFLVAMALFLFAVSVYKLFLGELSLPSWMLADNLHDLKAKLSSLVILVLAVRFLKMTIELKNAQDVLLVGVAVTLVSAALVAFSHFGGKD